jgi:hypothetical protein
MNELPSLYEYSREGCDDHRYGKEAPLPFHFHLESFSSLAFTPKIYPQDIPRTIRNAPTSIPLIKHSTFSIIPPSLIARFTIHPHFHPHFHPHQIRSRSAKNNNARRLNIPYKDKRNIFGSPPSSPILFPINSLTIEITVWLIISCFSQSSPCPLEVIFEVWAT